MIVPSDHASSRARKTTCRRESNGDHMTNKEIELTAKMLAAYSEYYLSPAGCNDTDPAWLAPFTEEERIAMNREFNVYNGSPQEDDGARMLSDFCYVGLMRHKLLKMAKE